MTTFRSSPYSASLRKFIRPSGNAVHLASLAADSESDLWDLGRGSMSNSAPTELLSDKPSTRRSVLKMLVWGIGSGLIAGGIVEAASILVGRNFHVVVSGTIYRCSQPSAKELERLIDQLSVRTVVNLRGCGASFPWYMEECRAAQRHAVALEDICFSAGRMPPSSEVQRLVEVLDHSEYPLLFHCYHGADRTGLASGVALLLRTDASLAEARKQLSPRYGHVPLGRTGNLDRFFDLYSQWLNQAGAEHSPDLFRQWVSKSYSAGECKASFSLLDCAPGQVFVALGKPFTLHVRCVNASVGTWNLRAGNNTGIHCCAIVNDEHGQCVSCNKSGLFDAKVLPGQHVDLTFAMQPIWQKGIYHLLVDMIDEHQGFFYQAGSEPLERELVVRE
jgi:predicted protein tyrosine phosphatase